MAKEIEGEKGLILIRREGVIKALVEEGWADADIARIMFNVDRSTITRIHQSLKKAAKK